MNPAAYGPVFVPVLVLIGFLIHYAVVRKHRTPEQLLTLAALWGLGGWMGVAEVITAGSHIVAPVSTALQIGFPPGNPFQWEVAMADLTFAVLGLACLRWRETGFWLASSIGYLVYFWGCAVGHFVQHFGYGNDAPYNWGPLVPVIIIVPLVLLVLVVRLRSVQRRAGHGAHEQQPVVASGAA